MSVTSIVMSMFLVGDLSR